MRFHADILICLVLILSHHHHHPPPTCGYVVLVPPPSRRDRAQRRDEGTSIPRPGPASRPAWPIQSAGTPAGTHAHSPQDGQGHTIFFRGASKHTAVKRRNTAQPVLNMPSTSLLDTQWRSRLTYLSGPVCNTKTHFAP